MGAVTCKMCGAQFDNEEDLKKHNAEAHGMAEGSESEVKCQMCGATFKSKEELDQHNKEAHGM